MKKKAAGGILALHALGAAGWAVFLSISPVVEVLIVSAILWIPLLVLSEVRRAREYGFWPGFPLRLVVAGAIVTVAALAPVKWEDQNRVEGLSGKSVTLAELSSAKFHVPADRAARRITLPENPPTFRQAIRAVEDQTGLQCRVGRCGNSLTILWGGYVMNVTAEATAR